MKLSGSQLSLTEIVQVSRGEQLQKLSLDSKAVRKIQESHGYLKKRIKKGDTIYGINTGFGAFSKVKISAKDILKLQVNLIRSHAVGVGEPLSPQVTRAILLLRANTLARGTSGVRAEVVEKIIEYLKNDVLPVVPSQGSVGASGDLAPLAHVALALIGEGMCWQKGQAVSTKKVLSEKNIKPLVLEEKEGLSLINGCQVMTAIGLLALNEAQNLLVQLDVSGAMSLEALRGSRSAFHELVSQNRPHNGEIQTAKNLRIILGKTSPIAESHIDCDRVQDAYSVRCMPAVHGSARDAIKYAIQVLLTEANSSTDNPLVFSEQDLVVSCGNFHGQPASAALDFAAIALTSLMSISERRIEKLINPAMSDLPAFLASQGGLNSGLMMVHVAAASLVSESKILAHPASVDSIPTSADKEDHVSMGTIAARKLVQIVGHLKLVLAMELLCANQALGFLRPLKPSGLLLDIHKFIEKLIPFTEEDRVFSADINLMVEQIDSAKFLNIIKSFDKGLGE